MHNKRNTCCNRPLKNIGLRGRIILKCILIRIRRRALDISGSGMRQVTGCCESAELKLRFPLKVQGFLSSFSGRTLLYAVSYLGSLREVRDLWASVKKLNRPY